MEKGKIFVGGGNRGSKIFHRGAVAPLATPLSVRCEVFFRASCFGGQLSWWQVCFAVSLHGGQFTAVSCLEASLRRPVVLVRC